MTTAGLTFRAKKSDGSFLYDCPQCNGKGKLELTRDRRLWYCHKCGNGGKSELFRGQVVREFEKKTFTAEEFQLIEDQQDPRYRYLSEKRGMTQQMINDLRPHSGGQWYIVYFPLYGTINYYTHPTYFVGRSLFNDEPKYRNPPLTQFPAGGKSKNLWGLHRLSNTTKDIVLCEGIFDAIWGKNRFALLGKTISQRQIDIIRRIGPTEITVFLDGNTQRESILIAKTLAHQMSRPIWTVDTPGGKDPDDLGKGFSIKDHRRRIA